MQVTAQHTQTLTDRGEAEKSESALVSLIGQAVHFVLLEAFDQLGRGGAGRGGFYLLSLGWDPAPRGADGERRKLNHSLLLQVWGSKMEKESKGAHNVNIKAPASM